MPQIADTAANRSAIAELVAKEYYVGSVSTKGFIIKRNFGIRRLPIYGIYKNNIIQISIKNEFLHQVFLIFGTLLFIVLVGLTIYSKQYIVSVLLFIMIVLMWLDNINRKNKEYQLLLDTIKSKDK